jgi:hypothetical protein
MKTKVVSVIGAVELELTEARSILNRLANQIGREQAERTFFDDLEIITQQNVVELAVAGSISLSHRIKSIALSILGLEIITENEVYFEE